MSHLPLYELQNFSSFCVLTFVYGVFVIKGKVSVLS